ncbi:MAG: MarR family winged helix-turn-helix transcriptional regulator [Thermoplasmata archaeon]|nr:MarR family winged helix-turn-helix transcriptional regulator [Thermoplasmata archaeon]
MIDLMMVFPRKANTVGRAIASKYMRDSRLKSYHLMLINAIYEQDGASQKDLGDAVPFDKSYISIGVRELIDMGYIVNEGQGKVHSLRLTEAGRDVLAMSEMMFDIIRQSIMGNITKEEADELVRILRKMSANMDSIIAQFNEKETSASKRWCDCPCDEGPE